MKKISRRSLLNGFAGTLSLGLLAKPASAKPYLPPIISLLFDQNASENSTLTVSLEATRLTGTAPMGVLFSADVTSDAPRVVLPFHDVEGIWRPQMAAALSPRALRSRWWCLRSAISMAPLQEQLNLHRFPQPRLICRVVRTCVFCSRQARHSRAVLRSMKPVEATGDISSVVLEPATTRSSAQPVRGSALMARQQTLPRRL